MRLEDLRKLDCGIAWAEARSVDLDIVWQRQHAQGIGVLERNIDVRGEYEYPVTAAKLRQF